MKKFIGLTAMSLVLGAATLGSAGTASANYGWDGGCDNDGTTVVVRTGDNDCGWGGGWNRCRRWNRCGMNDCRFGRYYNRCNFDQWGWGGYGGGYGGWCY